MLLLPTFITTLTLFAMLTLLTLLTILTILALFFSTAYLNIEQNSYKKTHKI